MRQILMMQTLNMDVVITLLLWAMALNAILGGFVILLLFRLAQCREKCAALEKQCGEKAIAENEE